MESQDLRKVGLKVTHPRIRILELLEQSKPRHMTAEDIYRHLLDHGDEIGLATVYRVLTQFEAAGLVLKHNFEGGQAVYELDRGKHHDHAQNQQPFFALLGLGCYCFRCFGGGFAHGFSPAGCAAIMLWVRE